MEASTPNGQVNEQAQVNDGQVNGHAHGEQAHHEAAPESLASDGLAPATSNRDTMVTTAATIGVVGVAAIVFEAALIPGIILGVAAALAPSYVPRLGAALNPLFRSTVRSAYKLGQRTKEAASEVREQMNDIVAEVNTENVTAEKPQPSAF